MTKTSVKFRKNRHKTVGGVAHTRYLSYIRGTEGRKDGRTEGRKAENYVPPLFFEKAGDKNKGADQLHCNCFPKFSHRQAYIGVHPMMV